MEFRKKGDQADISKTDMWASFCAVAVIVIIVLVVVTFFTWLIAGSEAKAQRVKNEWAAEYNALPLEERKILAESITKIYFENVNPETYTIEIVEIKDFWTTIKTRPLPAILFSLGLIFEAGGVVTAFGYNKKREKKYFYADFPVSSFGDGLLFFILMLSTLPFTLASAINMLLHWCGLCQKEHETVQDLAEKELKEDEVFHLDPLPVARIYGKASQRYHTRRTAYSERYARESLKQAETEIESTESNLREAGLRIQRYQRQLSDAKLKLQKAEALQGGVITPEQADQELKLISEMRGVSSMSVPRKDSQSRIILQALVKVRVPYQGVVYDFGDYSVTIYPDDFTCREVRSGVKENATSRAPHYGGSSFCFGDRTSEIDSYVKAGRIIDAMNLIIDSLHSVNEYDVEDIPRCFRQIKTVKKAAQQKR